MNIVTIILPFFNYCGEGLFTPISCYVVEEPRTKKKKHSTKKKNKAPQSHSKRERVFGKDSIPLQKRLEGAELLLFICIFSHLPICTFAQFTGGSTDGYHLVSKTDIVSCAALPAYSNISTGGSTDGYHLVSKTDIVSCAALPAYSNISTGGSSDGYHFVSKTDIVSCAALPAYSNVARGGNADGASLCADGGCYFVLPVAWLSFTAEPTGNTVRLEWITATEINNDYFSIERRTEDGRQKTGVMQWEQIGTVKGAGNSTASLSYIFYDEHPYSGISYYRIKQTDYDGKYKYSDVRAVFRGEMEIISVNPNPADDFINYQVGSPDGGEVTLKVIDITGKAVINQAEVLEKGVTTKKLSTANFSSGVYLLQISTPNKEKTQKQFVVK